MSIAAEVLAFWKTSPLSLERSAKLYDVKSIRRFPNSTFIAYMFADLSVLWCKGRKRGMKAWIEEKHMRGNSGTATPKPAITPRGAQAPAQA